MLDVVVTDHLGAFRNAWDASVLTAERPCPFLRSWWLESIRDANGRYVLVLDGMELVGGFPVEYHRKHGVERIRTFGDELRPIGLHVVARQPGDRQAVIEAVCRELRSRRDVMIEIDGLLPSAVAEAPAADLTVREGHGAPYLELPDSHEAFLAQRSANYRKDARRTARRLEAAGYHYRLLHGEETAWGLGELRRLHLQRFGTDSEFTPEFERFRVAAHAGVECGELRLHVIADGERAAAVSVTLELGDLVVGFQSGRDIEERELRGAGSVLLDEIIRGCCEQGTRELDFHRYPSEYKLRLATGVRPVMVAGGTWGPRTAMLLSARKLRTRLRRAIRSHRPHNNTAPVPSKKDPGAVELTLADPQGRTEAVN